MKSFNSQKQDQEQQQEQGTELKCEMPEDKKLNKESPQNKRESATRVLHCITLRRGSECVVSFWIDLSNLKKVCNFLIATIQYKVSFLPAFE